MSVGQRINERMKTLKMSQNQLAKAAQISQSGLSSIISGAVSPKEVTLSAIAVALGCSVAELMGEETEQQYEQPKTNEAKNISAAIDRMPMEQRKQAENVLRTLYEKYFTDDVKDKTS